MKRARLERARSRSRGAAPFVEAGLFVLVAVAAVMLALVGVRSSSSSEPPFLMRPHGPPASTPRSVMLPRNPARESAGSRQVAVGPGRRAAAIALSYPPAIRAELAAAAQKSVNVRLNLIASPKGGLEIDGSGSGEGQTANAADERDDDPPPDSGTGTAGEPGSQEGASPEPSPSPDESPSPDGNTAPDGANEEGGP